MECVLHATFITAFLLWIFVNITWLRFCCSLCSDARATHWRFQLRHTSNYYWYCAAVATVILTIISIQWLGHSFLFLQFFWPHQYGCTCQLRVLRPFSGGGPPQAQHQRPGPLPARLHFVLCRWQRSASLGSTEVTPDLLPTLGSPVWLLASSMLECQDLVWYMSAGLPSMVVCWDPVCCMAVALFHMGVCQYPVWCIAAGPLSVGGVRIWSAVCDMSYGRMWVHSVCTNLLGRWTRYGSVLGPNCFWCGVDLLDMSSVLDGHFTVVRVVSPAVLCCRYLCQVSGSCVLLVMCVQVQPGGTFERSSGSGNGAGNRRRRRRWCHGHFRFQGPLH